MTRILFNFSNLENSYSKLGIWIAFKINGEKERYASRKTFTLRERQLGQLSWFSVLAGLSISIDYREKFFSYTQ